MSETTLLPCPFCGGGARVKCYYDSSFAPAYEAWCNNESCGVFNGHQASEADAIAAWNTRAVAQPETPSADALAP
jgi:hypothetical protein